MNESKSDKEHDKAPLVAKSYITVVGNIRDVINFTKDLVEEPLDVQEAHKEHDNMLKRRAEKIMKAVDDGQNI